MGTRLRMIKDEIGEDHEIEPSLGLVVWQLLEQRCHWMPPDVPLNATGEVWPFQCDESYLYYNPLTSLSLDVLLYVESDVINQRSVWVVGDHDLEFALRCSVGKYVISTRTIFAPFFAATILGSPLPAPSSRTVRSRYKSACSG